MDLWTCKKKYIFFSKFTLEYILTVRYAIYSSLIRTAWFLPPSYMCVATFKSLADAEQVTRSKCGWIYRHAKNKKK